MTNYALAKLPQPDLGYGMCQLAAYICDTPIAALIRLIEGQLILTASVGPPEGAIKDAFASCRRALGKSAAPERDWPLQFEPLPSERPGEENRHSGYQAVLPL